MSDFADRYISKSVIKGLGSFDNFLNEGAHKRFKQFQLGLLDVLMTLGAGLDNERTQEQRTRRQALAIAAMQRRREAEVKASAARARAERDAATAERERAAAELARARAAEINVNREESTAIVRANATSQGNPQPPAETPRPADIAAVERENENAARQAGRLAHIIFRKNRSSHPVIDVSATDVSPTTTELPPKSKVPIKQKGKPPEFEVSLFAGIDPSKGIPSSYTPPPVSAPGDEKPKNKSNRRKRRNEEPPPSTQKTQEVGRVVTNVLNKRNRGSRTATPTSVPAPVPAPVSAPAPESSSPPSLGKARNMLGTGSSSVTPQSQGTPTPKPSPTSRRGTPTPKPSPTSRRGTPTPNTPSSKKLGREVIADVIAGLHGMSTKKREEGRTSRDPSAAEIDAKAAAIKLANWAKLRKKSDK